MINRNPDIEAEVTFLTTNEGGRETPARSGYRPNHLIKPDYLTCGQHEYLETEWIFQGQTACANIWFITPELYPYTLWVGKKINVQEGSRVVGYIIVTKIFNQILDINSEKLS
jgi:elongation factor Tu